MERENAIKVKCYRYASCDTLKYTEDLKLVLSAENLNVLSGMEGEDPECTGSNPGKPKTKPN